MVLQFLIVCRKSSIDLAKEMTFEKYKALISRSNVRKSYFHNENCKSKMLQQIYRKSFKQTHIKE